MKDSHGHSDPAALLKDAGLKATEQRKLIIKYLMDNHGPFTVEDIALALGTEKFDLARSTGVSRASKPRAWSKSASSVMARSAGS